MRSLQILSLPLFASFALAKQCTNVTVPVNIEARQGIFDIPEFVNNYDVTTFAQNFTSIKANFTAQALRGYQTVRGSYNISAKICKPDNDNKANPTVQFLTHGIGFDKSYWDLPFNGYNYSYTDVATDSFGFYTVAIDRFGIGNSSHGRTWDESVNLIQAPAEVSAIYEITNMLRNGTFPSTSKKFQKVVHIGHSFGSAESYLLSALHPEASDGIVLTGFSMNATWLPVTTADWNLHIARLNQPLRFGNITLAAAQNMWNYMKSYGNPDLLKLAQQFLGYAGIQVSTNDIWNDIATTEVGDIINQWNATVPPVPQNLPTGYTTWSDYTSNQFAFLYPGSFDIAIGIFAEMTKQPVTVGEIFTLASGAPSMSAFTGPVQVVTGREDAIYCGGDCMNTAGTPLASIPAGVQKAFPNAKAFQAYIQPNSGHGINLHYNSTGAYRVINNWLVSQGLGSS